MSKSKIKSNIYYRKDEMWVVVKDYPGYLVSNTGRVYSIKFRIELVQFYNNTSDDDYHLFVKLANDETGREEKQYVHRLVAQAFFGDAAIKGKDIHHINFKPDDNRIENLKPLTRSEHKKIHAEHKKMLKLTATANNNIPGTTTSRNNASVTRRHKAQHIGIVKPGILTRTFARRFRA